MKIIYSGIQKENYDERRDFSFEYTNFYLTLKKLNNLDVIEYPYDSILKVGKAAWNKKLLELIQSEKPDLFFAFMFTDELNFKTLDEIKKITTSIAWFADDHWRLWNYSRYYAPHFNWIITTWSKAPKIYAHYGIYNVIRSQWACNQFLWKPVGEARREIDVSFVGQYNSSRGRVIDSLRQAGVNVFVRGWGWPEGRASQNDMIKIFSASKINLNLNTPPKRWRLKLFARLLLKRSINRIVPDFWNFRDNLHSWLYMRTPQIKARPFEILACRTFLISGYADDMNHYYKDGKEIVYYNGSIHNLVEKIKYWLPREKEREKIAQAGYRRTIHEHTYEKRFKDIFKLIGFTK